MGCWIKWVDSLNYRDTVEASSTKQSMLGQSVVVSEKEKEI